MTNNNYMENIVYGVLSTKDNWNSMIQNSSALMNGFKFFDGVFQKDFFESCWLLDGNAFADMPAPKFMKMDAITMGGLEVLALLPTEKVDPSLVSELKSQDLDYTPVGFLDLHKIKEGKFVASGLGVAKPYQKNGLSKHIIAAGCEIANIQELMIPTQLSNASAHKAWLHLGPLEVYCADVAHEKPDSIIYKAKVPGDVNDILKPLETENGELVAFSEVKNHIKSLNVNLIASVIGYTQQGLILEYDQDPNFPHCC